MRKDAQAVLLLLIGGTLLKISFTGTYVRYVKPGQLPLLLIAGVVLIVIAGVTLWQVIRAPKQLAAPTADENLADEPSGFENLAAPGAVLAAPRAIEAAPRALDAPAKLSALRAPIDEDRPVSLSALRAPSAGSPVVVSPPSGAMSSGEEPTVFVRLDALPAGPEVTYREFTPGELVAVPMSHLEATARAAQARLAAVLTPLPEPEEPEEEDPGHGHVHGEPRIAWLLLLPALALLLFAPPALGSYQATRNGTALSAQADSDFPPLAAGDPIRISMLDYAGRAVFDRGTSLRGRRITLSGFIISGPNGEPYLARMIVTCCAADARPVKVGLAGDLPSTLKPDQWIEIEGTYVDRADKDPVNAELVPYIQVTSVRDITAPEEQYES